MKREWIMKQERPSRILMFYSLAVSGISCLVYCLSIALFVNPEMEEYALIIAIPFISFIFINLFGVYRASIPLDYLKKSASDSIQLSSNQRKLLNSKHYCLTYGLYPLIIISTILIHLLTMWLEDGSFDYLADPDSWSLLINRGSLFLLVAIIQGSVFDTYISKLKNEFAIKAASRTSRISLFKRLR